jgi:hypothetical protein
MTRNPVTGLRSQGGVTVAEEAEEAEGEEEEGYKRRRGIRKRGGDNAGEGL